MSRPSSRRTARARTARETSSAPFVSRDAQAVLAMLKETGINDYDPQVVNQLLEFNYRYSTTVLDDAKTYSNHAKKNKIDVDDVKVAVQMTEEAVISKPVSHEVLMSASREVNKKPLPLIKLVDGLQIPRDHTILRTDYALKTDTNFEKNIIKINTIKTAAEILEESKKKETNPSDEFLNDSIDFDLQDIINQLDSNIAMDEYVKDELLEFQPFDTSTCFDVALSNIVKQEWPTENE